MREKYLQTIDNIQQADSDVILTSQRETHSSSRYVILKQSFTLYVCFRLLESLEKFLDRVEISNSTTNQTVFAFKTFALQVQTVDPAEYQGQTFRVNLGSVEESVRLEQNIEQRDLVTSDMVMDAVTGATASIQLPEDLLECLNSSTCNSTSTNFNATAHRLSYSVFLLDTLFQNVNQSHLKIGSIIVAARLRDTDNTVQSTPVQTTFQINPKVY